ncbi:M4 family metallopeptidase, partial [Pseudomonadales bacterium]|nr:M4 family metallopeptidase [Pseudomonadales bacterium]
MFNFWKKIILVTIPVGLGFFLWEASDADRKASAERDRLVAAINGDGNGGFVQSERTKTARKEARAFLKVSNPSNNDYRPLEGPPFVSPDSVDNALSEEFVKGIAGLDAVHVGQGRSRVLRGIDGKPRSVVGNYPLTFENNSAEAMILFLRKHPTVFGLDSRTDIELLDLDEELGIARIGRTFKDLPVWGKGLVATIKDGHLRTITGSLSLPRINLDTNSDLSSQEIIDVISNTEFHSAKASELVIEGGEVGIFLLDGIPLYAHKTLVTGLHFKSWTVYISINSKTVVGVVPNFHSIDSSGTDLKGDLVEFNSVYRDSAYLLIDETFPLDSSAVVFEQTADDSVQYATSQQPDAGWDPASVSATVNAKRIYDYFLNEHNLDSYDGKGAKITSVVNIDLSDDDSGTDNAFWAGNAMWYGVGGELENFAIAEDVAAHEYTHGVIEHSSSLVYRNQSGALNESYADFFGVMVERENWLIGEELFGGVDAVRSMAVPEAFGQPSHIKDYVQLPESTDNGGVHRNSGIPNRALYLLAQGLTAEEIGESLGLSRTEELVFQTMTRLGPDFGFEESAIQMRLVAEELYGANSNEVESVKAAWSAVGITISETPLEDGSRTSFFEPAKGEILIPFLFPRDGSLDAPLDRNQEYDIYVAQANQPFGGYSSEALIGPINDYPAQGVAPSSWVRTNGDVWVNYVTTDGEAAWAKMDGSAPDFVNESTGNDVGYVARSGDGLKFAYVRNNSTQIRVYDFETKEWSFYEVEGPSYSQQAIDTSVLTVDALSFDYTGKKIIFDFLICTPNPDAESGCSDIWSLGILDLDTGFDYPFPSQQPSIDLGFPRFSNVRNDVFVFDVVDYKNFDESEKGSSRTFIYNRDLKEFTAVVDPNGSESRSYAFGIPAFVGADEAVSFMFVLDDSASMWQARLNVNEGSYSIPENPYDQLVPFDSGFGESFINAYQNIYANLVVPANVEFGSVEIGNVQPISVEFVNSGVRELEVTSVEVSPGVTTSLKNRVLQAGERIVEEVFIDEEYRVLGAYLGTLKVQHTGDNEEVTIGVSGFLDQDTDQDGIFDSLDSDDDNDGVLDTADAFPLISLGTLADTDGDGRPNDCDSACEALGMVADPDDDNDGVNDEDDAYPLDATLWSMKIEDALAGIVDDNLRACIAEAADGLQQVFEVTKLACAERQVSALNGLSGLTNLTDLSLSSNQITDISGL